MASEENMAFYERLSSEYQPAVTGPLVSQRLPTQVLVNEYSQADPIYVTKTKALAGKFPAYRTVRGDGNCGWRALAFGYFETLLGDPSRIRTEISRLQGLNTLISAIGYEEDLYIDFVEQTLDLLEKIAKPASGQDVSQTLLEQFNDDGVSNAIITHFRLITSAWMKSRDHLYKEFYSGGTIDQYRATYIDPLQAEIDHLGMQACIDAILKPVGIAVHVQYLDRSNLEEANTISSPGDSLNGHPILGTLTLLYRPGHYDILYANDTSLSVFRYLQEEDNIPLHNNPLYGSVPWEFFDMSDALPTFSLVGNNPVPEQAYASTNSFRENYPPVMNPSPSLVDNFQHPPPQTSPNASHRFRRTYYQDLVDYRQWDSLHTEPCQTDAMNNAGASTAHFMNKEFQPVLWNPNTD